MKMVFRIECPNCSWGFPWHDKFINQGWLKAYCYHCGKDFFLKIGIPTVSVEVQVEEPALPIKDIETFD